MTRVPFALLSGGALAAAVACMMTPAAAQTDPHQPYNDGSAAASMTVPSGGVAPGIDPGTTASNNQIVSQQRAIGIANKGNQEQYQADVDAYQAAMRAHGRQVAATDAHYAHQQRAYADAMAAWRQQDYACRHGSNRACNSPAPDPADFY